MRRDAGEGVRAARSYSVQSPRNRHRAKDGDNQSAAPELSNFSLRELHYTYTYMPKLRPYGPLGLLPAMLLRRVARDSARSSGGGSPKAQNVPCFIRMDPRPST